MLAPQRGLTAIAKSKSKAEKTTNCIIPELSNFGSPPAEPGVYLDQIINGTPLRFFDECVRHKILDIIGDFYLLGRMLRGHVHANMTGHTENVALVKKLRAVMPHPRG